MPAGVRDMIVKECKAAEFQDCDVVFSGLDAEVAGEIGRIKFPNTPFSGFIRHIESY